MPDRRRHRRPHPEDALAFAAEAAPALAAATSELSWLYTHGYAKASSVKIVGDRYSLTERQRIAVMRSACSDQDRSSRLRRQVAITALRGETVRIDGYNLLTTVEAALAVPDATDRYLAGVRVTPEGLVHFVTNALPLNSAWSTGFSSGFGG